MTWITACILRNIVTRWGNLNNTSRCWIQNSLLCIWVGYGLKTEDSWFEFPAGTKDFSLQTGCGAKKVYETMVTRCSFHWVNRSQCEAYHSPNLEPKLRKSGATPPIHMPSWLEQRPIKPVKLSACNIIWKRIMKNKFSVVYEYHNIILKLVIKCKGFKSVC